MAVGGVAELIFGVQAEGRSLEDIATPLTASGKSAKPGETGQSGRSGKLRPGPGSISGSWVGGNRPGASPQTRQEEIDAIVTALHEHGPTARTELEVRVGAKEWGPGRFAEALRGAAEAGLVRRASGRVYDLTPKAKQAGD